MRIMEVVAWIKGKTDMYQRKSLIEFANLVLDKNTGSMIEYKQLRWDSNYKYT